MTIREPNPEPSNPLGMNGIEFIEFATAQPQALGGLLQQLGFVPIARHRSREVMLYRQGPMNLIVNADPAAVAGQADAEKRPALSAIALRVRDAGTAWRRALDLGAWDIPTRASAMELHIPGICGVGDSQVYFVDRHRSFSIYDVDFVALPGVDKHPPALAGLQKAALGKGISFAVRGNLVILAPPLVIHEQELSTALSVLDDLLKEFF